MSLPERIGRYEILERVGRGGMGVVYRGRDPSLNREVAIKVLASDLDVDETARSRFDREGKAAARLQHPNIVTVFEFAEDQGTPYIVMEFVHGCSLAVLLGRQRLGLPQALDIGRQLCAGLDYAHFHGIVHRDVKPANVWLQGDGAVKLLDFGIARVAASALTRHGDIVGTAPYLAPEQIRGLEVDGRADVFAAGVIVFEMLAGRRPFEAESPTAIVNLLLGDTPAPLDVLPPAVPAAVRQAVGRALEKDPDRRYARAADFGSDLHLAALELRLDEPTIVLDGTATLLADGTATLLADGAAALPVEGAVTLAVQSVTLAADRAAAPLDDGAATLVVDRDPGPMLRLPQLASMPPLDLPLSGQASLVDGNTRSAARGSRLPVLMASIFLALVLVVTLVVWSGSRGGRAPDAHAAGSSDPASHGSELAPAAATTVPTGMAKTDVQLQSEPTRASIIDGGADTHSRTPARELLRPVDRTVTVVVRGSYPFEVVTREATSPASDRHELTVAVGQTIRLRSPEVFLDRRVAVSTGRGRQEVSAPGLGTLEVRTTSQLESCLVAIQGREVDYPTGLRVSIVAGPHLVSLVACPDGQTLQQKVEVAAGGVTQVRFR